MSFKKIIVILEEKIPLYFLMEKYRNRRKLQNICRCPRERDLWISEDWSSYKNCWNSRYRKVIVEER